MILKYFINFRENILKKFNLNQIIKKSKNFRIILNY